MSIVYRSKAIENAGLRYAVSSHAARRQLHVSLGLMALLAVAASAMAFGFQIEPQAIYVQAATPSRFAAPAPDRLEARELTSAPINGRLSFRLNPAPTVL
jgi:hypothetical protein